ncbi:MAG: acetyl-CoA C-acyltransferase, partial [Actinobacteria bacterium]|nr:acetyl-CoA C-acyltransferase [Actinomycetota bacterium]
ISADLIASVEGFSREECDGIAFDSQTRAAAAIAQGRFDRSLVPILHDDGTLALDHEEFPRAGTTLESLSKLTPSFEAMGAKKFKNDLTVDQTALLTYPQVAELRHVHHAGNSSGVVDGASAVLVVSSDYAKAHGLKPRAKITMTALAGTDPVIMLTAPGPATLRCLKKAGMTIDDIDHIEVNEAFAAVVLRFLRDTGADWNKCNTNGGAIALGHPIGATGGMLIGTAVDELERSDKQTALITMCTGGGMATATIIERV